MISFGCYWPLLHTASVTHLEDGRSDREQWKLETSRNRVRPFSMRSAARAHLILLPNHADFAGRYTIDDDLNAILNLLTWQ